MTPPLEDEAPMVGMRAFAGELKAQREARGWTQAETADRMGYSQSVVGKLEGCMVRPSEMHAQKADEAFGLPSTFQRLRALLMLRAYPDWFREWPGKEAAARILRWFELVVVPGLLQTEDYARALMANRLGGSQENIDGVVAARMERQAVLSSARPPELWVLLDEAALYRPIGGPAVMHEQMLRLAVAATQPHVCIQVIPAAVGVHEGLDGAGFVAADYDVAYVETAARGLMIDSAEDVAALAHKWDRLRAEALPRNASLELIEKAAEQWSSRTPPGVSPATAPATAVPA